MQGRRHTLRKALLLILLAALNLGAVASEICDGVGFLPTELIPTGAKELAQVPVGDEQKEVIDVHMYNHFYTFQVDRDVGKTNEGIEMLIPADKFQTNDAFAFRLRAEFNSAETSRTEMGFKVFLYSQDIGTQERTQVATASSLDQDGFTMIDITSLASGTDYVLRYEFYMKEIVRRGNSLSSEEDTIASRDKVVRCNLPFFTQELVFVEKKVLKSRVRKYLQSDDQSTEKLSKLNCDFDQLQAKDGVEGGLDCDRSKLSYQLKGRSLSGLTKLAEYPIKIAGLNGRPITQYFQVNFGSEFAFAAGFRAVIRRKGGDDTFACLHDQSCQMSKRNEKNHVSLNVVLTTGEYLLQFYDQSSDDFQKYIAEDLGLEDVPIYMRLEAYPILQNEERSTCPYMFLTQDFIQNKFITNQQGQKFAFSDKTVIDLVNLEQRIMLNAEQASYLKVHAREAFGVNLKMQICKTLSSGDVKCDAESQQIGNVEVLVADVPKNSKNYIRLTYFDSILAFHSYSECPHIQLEISLVSQTEASFVDHDLAEMEELKDASAFTEIFKVFNEQQTPFKLDEPQKATFKIQRDLKQSFQVLSESHFNVDVKMGLFVEIFSSPFTPEVISLFLKSDTNSNSVELLNRFKSSRSIWVDLEPGDYTLQAICTLPSGKSARNLQSSVTFQIYLAMDFINVARDSFIPKNLNYMGLLGFGQQSKDFGQVILFYDDVALFKEAKAIHFSVVSEMTSLSIQLEQDEFAVYRVTLYAKSSDNSNVQAVGETFRDTSSKRKMTSIQMDLLVPNISYTIMIKREKTAKQSATENSELGERYSDSFSLKLEFSENDVEAISDKIRRQVKENLPDKIESVQKVKIGNPGMREAAFKMGNRDIVGLLENPNGKKVDMTGFVPYMPKDGRIYTSLDTSAKIVASLPFQVESDSELFFAGVYEYTEGVNLLSLVIYEDVTHEEVAFSSQGKYYSRIDGAVLTKGSYYLAIRNDKSEHMNVNRSQAPIQFVIDVLRLQESATDPTEFVEAMELCPLPGSPSGGINRIGYVHPLSGNNMQSNMLINLLELDSGATLPLKIKETSLLTAYIEVPNHIEVVLSIKETGGLRKVSALSTDQDATVSNFLKQKGFKNRNVVSLRTVLAPGTYWIQMQADSSENSNVNFDANQNFCDTFMLSLGISNTKSAMVPYFQSDQEEHCLAASSLPQQLKTNTIQRGWFVSDLSSKDMEVTYFDFSNEGTQGPYLVYFQLDYDMRQEGPVGVVLSQYDQDELTWKEIGLYMLADNQSTVLKIVERGVYGISIQPIESTSLKFEAMGLSKAKLLRDKIFASGCFKARYTYFATSVNAGDSEKLMIVDDIWDFFNLFSSNELVRNVIALETQDDIRDLNEFSTCQFDNLPLAWPETGSFEYILSPRIDSQKFDIVEIIVPEDSWLRVQVTPRSDKVKVTVYIIDEQAKDKTIAATSTVTQSISLGLKARQKAYKMKIVYWTSTSDDPCLVYDLQVAMKPFAQIANENLLCVGNPSPPELYPIKDSFYKVSRVYQFSGEYLDSDKPKQWDFQINFDHMDYLLDLLVKMDFLSTDFSLTAYVSVGKDEAFTKVAVGEPVFDFFKKGPQSNQIGSRTKAIKLRYLQELDAQSSLASANKIIVRLTIGPENYRLMAALKDRGIFSSSKPICFNFDFNLLAIEEKQAVEQPKDIEESVNTVQSAAVPSLISVQYTGTKMGTSNLIAEDKIIAILEFDLPLNSETIQDLQRSSVFALHYVPLDYKQDEAADQSKDVIMPTSKTVLSKDTTMFRLVFKANLLKRGACYKLEASQQVNSIKIDAVVRDSPELQMCTSSCHCSLIGTATCNEMTDGEPECICRNNYTGEDCSQCTDGFVHNDKGECVKGTVCIEDGGEEDCNGHGQCSNIDGKAHCECDEGFTNDGLDLCGRCSDPLFAYPHECQKLQRQYSIIQPNYECSKLPYQMPKSLFEVDPETREKQSHTDSDSPPAQTIVYEKQGVVNWQGRYSLVSGFASNSRKKTGLKIKKSSETEFMVKTSSFVKIYLNTMSSGSRVKYAVLDSNGTPVMSSDEFTDFLIEFDKVSPVPGENQTKPFKLLLEFEREAAEQDQCPMLELYLSIVPITFQQKSLKCTNSQKQALEGFEDVMELWSVNKIRQEKVILNSSMIQKDGQLGFQSMDSEFLYNKIKLKVMESGHALSIFTSVEFTDLHTTLTLRDSQGRPIRVEKTSLLGEVPLGQEVYRENPSTKESISLLPEIDRRDLISFIEIESIDEGEYTLEIGVPLGYFVHSSKFDTCLEFDLIIEYISRRKLADDYNSDEEIPIQILAVSPLGVKRLTLADQLSIQLIFDKHVDSRRIASGQSELNRVCTLQYGFDTGKPTVIVPEQTFFYQNFATLNFNFIPNNKVLRPLFDNNSEVCLTLVCQSEKGKALQEIVQLPEIEKSKYCLVPPSVTVSSIKMCNGFAKPKFENGRCVCTFPYTGDTCDSCEEGFTATRQMVSGKYATEDATAVVCEPEKGSKYEQCNGFGDYSRASKKCVCDSRHSGFFCEECADSLMEYPDCLVEQISNVVDSVVMRDFNKQRRKNVYTKEDYLQQDIDAVFRQQCPLTNYPTSLNEIHYHLQFASGDFHLSDYFVTNHDADNVIQFTPRTLGSLKVMVKQPESYTQVSAQEAMDIEVAISLQGETKFIALASNYEIDYKGSLGVEKTDLTLLNFDITDSLLDVPLLIFFRSSNYTHDELRSTETMCQSLYIEIEFRSRETAHACNQDLPNVTQTRNPIRLLEGLTEAKGPVTFKDQGSEGFFFYQDYFLDPLAVDGYSLTVSLAQKFSDPVTIVPIIEILATEQDDPVNKKLTSPQCLIFCEIGGAKSYNEMSVNVVVPYGTLFRVWLYKKSTSAATCLNYELQIKNKALDKPSQTLASQNLRCEHLTSWPKSLNVGRYLGKNGQRDFEYIENFHIEEDSVNLYSTFSLANDSLIRIEGLQHREIRFNIALYKGKQRLGLRIDDIIPLDEAVHEPESTVFTALAAGDYSLRIMFLNSQLDAISQPCQSIQIHMAMTQIKNLKQDQPDGKTVAISMEKLLDENKKSHFFEYSPSQLTQTNGDSMMQAVDIVYQSQFMLEPKTGINLEVSTTSDFLRLDISFLVVNMQTRHIYSPLSVSEDKKKLLVPDIPGGTYKLYVYARRFDGRISGRILQSSRFKMYIHLFSSEENQKSVVSVMTDGGWKKLTVSQTFREPEHMICKAKYSHLPRDLMKDQLSQSRDFMINFAVSSEEFVMTQTRTMQYSPSPGKDFLRLQITDGIKLAIYRSSDYNLGGKPFATSVRLNNQMEELVASRLDSDNNYTIELTFGDYDSLACVQGKLQVLISSYQEVSSSTIQEESESYSWQLSVNSPPVEAVILATDPNDLQSAPTYSIILDDPMTDLEVALDYSIALFAPKFILMAKPVSGAKSDLLDSMANVVEASNVLMLKHQIKATFNSLAAGEYHLTIMQPGKQNVENQEGVFLTIIASLPLHAHNQSGSPIKETKKFLSKASQSVVRRLALYGPVDLNSIKFLGGGGNEASYMLFSDYISISESESNNSIRLDIASDDTRVRIYFEDSSLIWSVTLEGDDEASVFSLGNVLEFLAPIGKHVVSFKHYTEQAKQRAIFYGDQVFITVLVAEKDFLESQYESHMKEALTGCGKSEFPLALAKNTKLNAADEQSYYSYPLIRVYQFGDEDLATYSFRFNETQRVYFELGSNFVSSNAVLKLSPKPSRSAFTIGKQSGNVNVLDVMVPAGDYHLVVHNLNAEQYECGVFSLKGLLNQQSAMMSTASTDAQGFIQGTLQCDIKGDQLPSVIYASKDAAMGGNEEFINDDGVYFQRFSDVMIAKNFRDVIEPWTQEIEITAEKHSVFKIFISAEFVDKMSVSLYNRVTGQPSQPLFNALRKSQTGFEVTEIKELTYMFELAASGQYSVIVEFFGDMRTNEDDFVACAYFDAILSIQSMHYMYKKVSCDSKQGKFDSLIGKIPKEITQGEDFSMGRDFEKKGFFKVSYPSDYANIRGSNLLSTTKIVAKDDFEVSASIMFDLPMSEWQIQVLKVPPKTKYAEQNALKTETIADAGVLIEISAGDQRQNANQSVVRQLKPATIRPDDDEEISYILAWSDEQSQSVLSLVSQYATSQNLSGNLCLPVNVSLTVKQVKLQKAIARGVPNQILDFRFLHGSSQSAASADSDSIAFLTKYAEVLLLLSSEPTTWTRDKAISLYLDCDGAQIAKFKAIDVSLTQQDQDNYLLKSTFKFDLSIFSESIRQADSSKLKIDVDNSMLRSDSDAQFDFSAGASDKLHQWSIAVKSNSDKLAALAIEQKREGSKIKSDLDVKEKPVKKVKCLCVNGTCKDGESKCEKCFDGFEGLLCDIRKSSYNRSGAKVIIEDEAEIEDVVFRQGKKAIQVQDEGEETPKQKPLPKYQEITAKPVLDVDQDEAAPVSLEQLKTQNQQGFMSRMFFGFVDLQVFQDADFQNRVKLVLQLAGILIGLYVLYWLALWLKDKRSLEQIAKERKSKKMGKKQESDYEGVNFTDDSADDENGLVQNPNIEMTSITNRTKRQAVKKDLKSFNSADSGEDSDEEKHQTPSGHSDPQDQPMTTPGDSIIGEIDDALKDMSDDSDEFESFV